jgi:Ca-activated chloride channel family protein
MRSIYGILFGTLFVVFVHAGYLDQAIACPDDPKALYNAGTELYLQDDYSKSVCFLDRAKKCVAQKSLKDLNNKDLAENISLNLAHSLVKAEKYQEALAEYKDLYSKFKNSKAAKNIPILEKFLQQQEQQDKQQNNDQNKNEDQNQNQDQEAKDEQNNLNSKSDNKSEQTKDDFDQKNKQKKNEKFDKKQDQKDEELKQEKQKDKQSGNTEDSKKNQAYSDNPSNSKHQNYDKQKMHNQQILDKDEQALLQAIEDFDQDMMKLYAAANCGGAEDNGW